MIETIGSRSSFLIWRKILGQMPETSWSVGRVFYSILEGWLIGFAEGKEISGNQCKLSPKYASVLVSVSLRYHSIRVSSHD